MKTIRAPRTGLNASVAASLASILELDVADVPLPADEHPKPWTVWSNWLAQRGLGLVPIAEPSRFEWPGPWVAVLRTGVAAVAYGAPPGLAWQPLDGPDTFGDVEYGFVIAPTDVALWRFPGWTGARAAGAVEAIVVAPEAEATPVTVERAAARAGRGLDGDRYFHGQGTFSNAHGRGHDLTLVEAEVLEELGLIAPAQARRNVVTRGIDLNALVGRRFAIGGVECFGQRLCEPCSHLERLTEPGVLRAFIHRGGLRADVLTDGDIAIGDTVRADGEPS